MGEAQRESLSAGAMRLGSCLQSQFYRRINLLADRRLFLSS